MMSLKEQQQHICARYHSDFEAPQPDEIVAVALATLGRMPIVGERIVLEDGKNVSWFIHCGAHSDADDFYQAVHWHHLAEMLPEVLPYLGLAQGFRFMIDREGHEEVWYQNGH